MNNLQLIQVAAFNGSVRPTHETEIPLGGFATILPPSRVSPFWRIAIADDSLIYEFDNFASAMDFAADEFRLAN